MSEDGTNQEAEIWIRYMRAGLSKHFIDFSALHRLNINITTRPELNEMHASILSGLFDAVRFTSVLRERSSTRTNGLQRSSRKPEKHH